MTGLTVLARTPRPFPFRSATGKRPRRRFWHRKDKEAEPKPEEPKVKEPKEEESKEEEPEAPVADSAQSVANLTISAFADFDGTQAAAGVSLNLDKPTETPSSEASDTLPATIDPAPNRLPAAYDLVKTLNGSLGVFNTPIHLVRQRISSKLFIIKQVPVRDATEWPSEAALLEDLVHPNIIGIESVHYDHNGPFCIANIVLPYCSGGDVQDFASHLRAIGKSMPVQFIQHYVSSMLDALLYLHNGETYNAATDTIIHNPHHSTILHRDNKERNTFLDPINPTYGLPHILLADFGLSSYEASCTNICGTEGYMCPSIMATFSLAEATSSPTEQLTIMQNAPAMTPCSDWFSFGVTLYQLITLKRYQYAETEIFLDFANSTSMGQTEIMELMADCLEFEPGNRPRAEDSLRLHRLSAKLKKQLQEWDDAGGRLPDEIWPEPFRFERVGAGADEEASVIGVKGKSDDTEKGESVPGSEDTISAIIDWLVTGEIAGGAERGGSVFSLCVPDALRPPVLSPLPSMQPLRRIGAIDGRMLQAAA
ncbi:hypothetical protein CBER1_10210 [Cercospora berteroae]|uniref:non-specific serine/threonine protein kinase n=1 Tax=Cercospora berteroae TaxID=357750 RepID=A0A2S6CES4_9PEZI|nr:hypothetical protein CBER1_10210 [Cercospora berteroae]